MKLPQSIKMALMGETVLINIIILIALNKIRFHNRTKMIKKMCTKVDQKLIRRVFKIKLFFS